MGRPYNCSRILARRMVVLGTVTYEKGLLLPVICPPYQFDCYDYSMWATIGEYFAAWGQLGSIGYVFVTRT